LGEQDGVKPVGLFGIALLFLGLRRPPARLVILAIILLELATGTRVLGELNICGRYFVVVCEIYMLLGQESGKKLTAVIHSLVSFQGSSHRQSSPHGDAHGAAACARSPSPGLGSSAFASPPPPSAAPPLPAQHTPSYISPSVRPFPLLSPPSNTS
jgi:hypothetical protein